jgi:hypothetical protein
MVPEDALEQPRRATAAQFIRTHSGVVGEDGFHLAALKKIRARMLELQTRWCMTSAASVT